MFANAVMADPLMGETIAEVLPRGLAGTEQCVINVTKDVGALVYSGGLLDDTGTASEDDQEVGIDFVAEFVEPDVTGERGGDCGNGRPIAIRKRSLSATLHKR